MFTPLNKISGTKNPTIGAHLLNLNKNMGIQIKKGKILPPPLHEKEKEVENKRISKVIAKHRKAQEK